MLQADKISKGLAELEAMDRAKLAKQWQKTMNQPPPKAASRVFLLRALSYELQARTAPGLSKADLKALKASLGANKVTSTPSTDSIDNPPRIALVPGARLVREWNGRSYSVSVIEEGYVYKDRIWSSLSAIAKDITGAHWSGPRFFGVGKAA